MCLKDFSFLLGRGADAQRQTQNIPRDYARSQEHEASRHRFDEDTSSRQMHPSRSHAHPSRFEAHSFTEPGSRDPSSLNQGLQSLSLETAPGSSSDSYTSSRSTPHPKGHDIPIHAEELTDPGPSASSSSRQKKKTQTVNPEEVGFKFEPNLTSALPKKPGYGREGRRIRLISNCFPIKIPNGNVYHYDVQITKKKPQKEEKEKIYACLNTKLNRKIISLMLESNPIFRGLYAAYDGRYNLYTRRPVCTDFPFTCEVVLPDEYPGRPGDPRGPKCELVRVEIKPVSVINLDSIHAFFDRKTTSVPQDAIMAVETILRNGNCLRFTPVYRSFYYPPDPQNLTPFGGGLEIWFGFHQSVRICEWKPTVNLDISATTFWQAGPVLNFIAELLKRNVNELSRSRLGNHDINLINKKLSGRHVTSTHLGYKRKYTILSMRKQAANSEYFSVDDGRISVSQYFAEQHRINLRFPNFPCLHMKPEKKNVFLPPELCDIVPGQHSRAELTSDQKSKMIEFTSRPPQSRFQEIHKNLMRANFNRDRCVQEFGLQVSDRPLGLEGRVIDPPNLMYKDRYDSEKQILPRDGSWNIRDTFFWQGANIPRGILLSFIKYNNLDEFVRLFKNIGTNLGLNIDGHLQKHIRDVGCDKRQYFSDLKQKGVGLVIIIIPSMKDERDEKKLYAEIKTAAETEVGLITQCLKEETLNKKFGPGGKGGAQVVNNLFLKINAKLGGENNSLLYRDVAPILFKPAIVFGADVNHPAATQPNLPSIAACVGSLDCLGKRFAISLRLQENSNMNKRKKEVIDELQDMVKDLLVAFYRHTKQKPEKIIFYRDGVSEGEFLTVKTKEVVAIRKACLDLQGDYKPGITFIVVQKRHHVRFKPEDRRDGVGRMQNIPPGTVVDTVVTHPVNFDFFLCSQLGIQGN